jgi:hypothetical protein
MTKFNLNAYLFILPALLLHNIQNVPFVNAAASTPTQSITFTSSSSTTAKSKSCIDDQDYIFKLVTTSTYTYTNTTTKTTTTTNKKNNTKNVNQTPKLRNKNKSCYWVGQDPKIRCNLVDENNISIKERCRASCNNCYETTISTIKTAGNTTTNGHNADHATSSTLTITSSIRDLGPESKKKKETPQLKRIGQYCTQDSDCSSSVCREKTCFGSENCKSIKHDEGAEFHEKAINIVLVGSGFTDLKSWRETVAKTFGVFNRFDFFDFDNPMYNAFYVDEYDMNDNSITISGENDDSNKEGDGFCYYDCEGVETLLCCDVRKARELSNKCFHTGPNLQTIVIHNGERYAGGGYRYQNMATTSIHELGPTVAIHELGHSLFELGDEYNHSRFDATSSPNCDVEGCPKWADLNEHMGGGLCEVKGCENGNSFVGENSFMRVLDAPMGHVNLRYTCCTFLALTKGLPPYCEKYDFGNGLLKYCQQDYQKYGGEQVYIDNDGRAGESIEYTSGKYVLAVKPASLVLGLTDGSFLYTDPSAIQDQGPALVLRRDYLGDYPHMVAVCDTLLSSILVITLKFDTGDIQTLYFETDDYVDVPPENSSTVKTKNDVTMKSSTLEIVVDVQRGLVIDVQIEDVELTLWLRIKTWVTNHFRKLLGWLFSNDDEAN